MDHNPNLVCIIILMILLGHRLIHARPADGYDKGDKGPLRFDYYDKSCPNLGMIVRWGVWAAFKNDTRIAASLLRLHFHDCFVDGCEGSVLLDDTKDFKGEKNAFPNRNSARGFEVIDAIKADVEKSCPSIVSCVDILAIAAREAVVLSGGPFWPVGLGRLDGLSASEKSANEQLPSPFEPLDNITAKFVAKGLDAKDMVVLSGGHTIGFAQCATFKRRLFNFKGSGKADPSLDTPFLSNLQTSCPNSDASNAKLIPLDAQTIARFDNAYYNNIVNNSGLLESDQALITDPKTAAMVKAYGADPFLFAKDFAASMMKLGNIGVLTGQAAHGQVRNKCGFIN
ncbi:peroxidase 10 [Salvia miltiorrhiza]|uniref:peroxidase 10 n=1 Tax=Salvia miltiorrhiza TaxID=226208 RepID=UPI0025AC6440|nr:peroxidase 10 [Salvia miltiorrhiza]